MTTSRLDDPAGRLLRGVDRGAAALGLRLERPALLSLLFHSVFDSRDEIERNLVHPQEALTVEVLRQCIEQLLEAGYVFVSVADIQDGLEPGRFHACLTFDDGYANNLRAVALLEEYGVPAAVFVSTGHVASARRFWWDTIYAERRRRGAAPAAVEREIAAVKARAPELVESYLEREFGTTASTPASEVDRPLTPQELAALARNPLVTIGNHTMDHLRLTMLEEHAVRAQLVGAQSYIEDVTALRPRAVAYPNGDADDRVVAIARDVGLAVGFTTSPRRENVPIVGTRLLRLGRYQIAATGDTRAELTVVRSGVQVLNAARRARRRLGGVLT